jgi:phosphatidylglycerol:prolipoprotein diacylglycerol transferase
MATGFLLCWILAEKLSGRKDLSNFLMCLMLSGVAGSRIAYVIEHWQAEFAADPLRIVRIDQGGLMFYGGFILAMVFFFVWCRIHRERPLALADLMSTLVPLGHAFGRIGCFFYGCCYGKDSDAWCSVVFPAGSPSWYEHGRRAVSVLPTQLFEAAALLALFALLMAVYVRFRRYTTGIYLVGYAVIRFGMEYLRGDPRAAVGPFSISQTISLAMAAFGVLFLFVSVRSKRASGVSDE